MDKFLAGCVSPVSPERANSLARVLTVMLLAPPSCSRDDPEAVSNRHH
jgi:hypothetical protein